MDPIDKIVPRCVLCTVAIVFALGLALVPGGARADQVSWPQFNFDARHGGTNSQESVIHLGNVSTLHVLYSVTLPSVADSAPAYLSGVVTSKGKIEDLLFLTTKDGRILALDADTGATEWTAQPATGPWYTTSSPALDPSGLYVYSYALDGKVHKYQVGDGTEVTTGGWPQTATLKPDLEKGSAALGVATSKTGRSFLYAAGAGFNDNGDYQGHVTVIDLASGAQRVFNAMCSDSTSHFVENGTPDCPGGVEAGIWSRPGVVYDPDLDKIFFATGNGAYNASSGGHYWGDSVLELFPDGTGAASGGGMPVDSYTPTEHQQLADQDLDLGSSAPVILPTPKGTKFPHLAAQCGKDAIVRLLNLDNLSGMGSPAHVGGELQKVAVPQGNQVLPQPAVWVNPADGSTWLFVVNYSGISGFQLGLDGSGNPTLTPMWTNHIAGSSPVLANGILFYASTAGMFGLDPTTGKTLWNDISIGNLHWESPIVINGRIYITDEKATLWVYGPTPATLNFYTVTPCRAIDTRGPAGPFGAPSLSGNDSPRVFQLAGQCGVPPDALAVAANITIIRPTAGGDLRFAPAGVAVTTSTVNFQPGQILANNAILSLTGNPLGGIAVSTDTGSGGLVDLALDISGYFK
ncbi:MAG: PQQ-binding-like beta-propeller repeat protein [Acidobacteriota bacterium]|nr:PQQ-binding-like beta-propeller repeat protein [Acidobacteriota bacterium]